MASPFVPIQSPSGLLAIPAGTPGSGTPTEGGIRSGRKSTTFALASKVILVLYRLPVIPKKTESGWTFSWDEDALYLTGQGLRRGIQSKAKLVWIGYPNAYIPPAEQAQVKGTLERDFGCVPVFLPDQLVQDHYHGFCKETLWLMLHNMTDFSKPVRRDFNRAHWEAYCKVNQAFAEAIDGHYGRDDIIWIHDYHLLVLPTYVRARQQAAKIGIFLHTPFPTSEVFRTLPVRDEILRGMLNATLVGFHLFDFARHFVSCCTRLLGLQFESRRGGFLGVEYEGRHVMVRVSHVGCDPDRFIQRLDAPDVREATRALADKYHDKRVLLGIDDMDKLKGIPLKLMAFQYLLQNYRSWAGKLVLVQIALPKSARKGETDAVREEVRALVEAINAEFGRPGYTPVEYAERNISFDERVELYSIADVVVNTSIRDGLNLVPYEFVCCSREKSGMLVASEFTGCSRSLSGVILVNPFNSEQVAAAVDKALTMSHEERIAKHEKDYEHIAAHSTMTWADSFLADLDKAAEKARGQADVPLAGDLRGRLPRAGGQRALRAAQRRVGRAVLQALPPPPRPLRLQGHARARRRARRALRADPRDPALPRAALQGPREHRLHRLGPRAQDPRPLVPLRPLPRHRRRAGHVLPALAGVAVAGAGAEPGPELDEAGAGRHRHVHRPHGRHLRGDQGVGPRLALRQRGRRVRGDAGQGAAGAPHLGPRLAPRAGGPGQGHPGGQAAGPQQGRDGGQADGGAAAGGGRAPRLHHHRGGRPLGRGHVRGAGEAVPGAHHPLGLAARQPRHDGRRRRGGRPRGDDHHVHGGEEALARPLLHRHRPGRQRPPAGARGRVAASAVPLALQLGPRRVAAVRARGARARPPPRPVRGPGPHPPLLLGLLHATL